MMRITQFAVSFRRNDGSMQKFGREKNCVAHKKQGNTRSFYALFLWTGQRSIAAVGNAFQLDTQRGSFYGIFAQLRSRSIVYLSKLEKSLEKMIRKPLCLITIYIKANMYEGKYDCIAISAVKGSIYGRSSND